MTKPMEFVKTGSYPTRSGNQVHALIDGMVGFRRICQAIDEAQQSVWATVTFMWPSFQMPDDRGSALDVFERAGARGIDVRLLFWRPEDRMEKHRRNAFWGSRDHFKALSKHYRHINIRNARECLKNAE